MAEVWLAIDLALDRRVAVKWLKPTLATDEVVAERFRREARAAASLDHSNIVGVYDVFEQDGRQAVVMQLVDGKSLRQLLDTQKRLSPELTCHIGSAVAAALDHAHDRGFVHRDVKPGNIMITPDGRVLLTDFGIAKGLHGESGDDLTSDNIMMGTAKYLSPEQVRGKPLDGRADLYSLGLVLYECLAGRVPFLGESDADTALARLQRDPTDLARLRATLPTRLVNVIHQLLARNPDRRPSTGAELVVELKAAAAEGSPEIDPTDAERSPVAPFSAGRLMRAPSDLRGRAQDRQRASRGSTPPRGRTKRGDAPSRPTRRPDDPHTRADRSLPHPSEHGDDTPPPIDPMLSGPVEVPPQHEVTSDPTPPAGHTLRGAPARGLGHSWKPSLTVVGLLLAGGLALAVVLWLTLEFGGGDSTTSTTVLPDEGAALDDGSATNESDAATPVPAGDPADTADTAGAAADTADSPGAAADADQPVADPDARIASVATFDPTAAGGDGQENDELLGALTDGDTGTDWRTSCYSNEFMGAKDGVGIVLGFDAPTTRALQVDISSSNYNISVFGATGETPPADLAGWGPELHSTFGNDPASVTVPAPAAPVEHVLILVRQLGPDSGCSDANPFRGRLAEITPI